MKCKVQQTVNTHSVNGLVNRFTPSYQVPSHDTPSYQVPVGASWLLLGVPAWCSAPVKINGLLMASTCRRVEVGLGEKWAPEKCDIIGVFLSGEPPSSRCYFRGISTTTHILMIYENVQLYYS